MFCRIAPILLLCFAVLSSAPAFAEKFVAKKVIDGDTIRLSNGERVRLIGIDTPETQKNAKAKKDSARTGKDLAVIQEQGRKAKEFLRKLVEGKEVRLEYDVQRRDRYGRLLAYVFMPVDGSEKNINAVIVENGYASVMTVPPNVKYSDTFVKLYREARTNKRGLWQQE